MKCVPYVLKYRIYTSFVIIIVCFFVTVGPALSPAIRYPYLFFAVTMVLVIIQSICSAILLNCFYSLASTLPSQYIQGIISSSRSLLFCQDRCNREGLDDP